MSHQMPTGPQMPYGQQVPAAPPGVAFNQYPGVPAAAPPRRSPRTWVSLALGLLGFGFAVGSLFGSWMAILGRGGEAVPRSLWVLVGNLGQAFGDMSAAPAGYLVITGLLLVAVALAVATRGRAQEVARAAGAALAVVGLVNLVSAAMSFLGVFAADSQQWPMRAGSTIWLGMAATALLGAAAIVAAGRGPAPAPAPQPDGSRWPWTFWTSGVLAIVGLVAYVVSTTLPWRVRHLHARTTTDLPETIELIMKAQADGVGGGLAQLLVYLAATPLLVLAVVPAHLLPGRAHRYGRVVAAVLAAGAFGNLIAMMLDVSGLGTAAAVTYSMGTGWWLGLVAVLSVGAAAVVAPGNLIGRLTRRPVPPSMPAELPAAGRQRQSAAGLAVTRPSGQAG